MGPRLGSRSMVAALPSHNLGVVHPQAAGCERPARPTDAPCLPQLCKEGGLTAAGRLKC